MQRVLTFVHNKKKYVSKPWCFGAATLVEKNTWTLQRVKK